MSIYDFNVRTIVGTDRTLADYRGQVLLIVNVASRCGLTPQYTGLEALYQQFRARGFAVLGFPCNQFGHQEPGSDVQIAEFCSGSYGVSFALFSRVDVNGANAHPLFRHLKSRRPGLLGSQAIKWNFTKFLVGRDGAVRTRYSPRATPASLAADIETALG